MKCGLILLSVALLGMAGCKGSTNPPPSSPDGGQRASESAAGRRARGERARPEAAAGNFDYYLLNLSWSPEYCHSHPTAAECAAHDAFVLHGLWPENTDGSYPENCSNAPGPANPAQYQDVYPDPSLLEHEWKTHGTCSGLDPDAYFQAARNAYRSVKIPSKLSGLTAQASLPPDEIVGLFRGSNSAIPESSLVVSCGHNYLTAVEICLNKSFQPAACTGLKTCGATTVKIPAP